MCKSCVKAANWVLKTCSNVMVFNQPILCANAGMFKKSAFYQNYTQANYKFSTQLFSIFTSVIYKFYPLSTTTTMTTTKFNY